MQSRRGRRASAGVWQRDGVSWPALMASIGINALAWTALVLIYQRAGDGLQVVAQPRTPIVWLKPVPDASRSAGSSQVLPKAAKASTAQPSTTRPSTVKTGPNASSVVTAESAPLLPVPPPTGVDDAWSDNQQETRGVKLGGENSTPLFRTDPLRLHRASHFPAQLARLKLRMRGVGGPAARAKMKACSALLGQWESMRMNASTDQVPLGMQPAGRQAVWRTLQEEGCLD